MGRRRGIWLGCVALALFGVQGASVARAVEPPARSAVEAGKPAASTVVFVRAAAGDSAASFDALAAQLRELEIEVVSAEPMGSLTLASQAFRAAELARSHAALGTVWLGEDDSAQLRVYVYDAKHRQLASRTLKRPDAAVREEVAVVLRSAISALIAGVATELEPVSIPPPTTAPPPPKPPPPEHRVHALVGLGYAGTTYASGTFENGLQLLLALQPTRRVQIGLAGTWLEDASLSGGGAEAILERIPTELFAGYAFAENPRFRAYAELGLQVDYLQRTTRITDPRLSARPSEIRTRFAVSPHLRTLFEPSKRLLAFAAFGADITTDRYDYVVQSASGPVRLAARTVRPRLEAGVAVRFW